MLTMMAAMRPVLARFPIARDFPRGYLSRGGRCYRHHGSLTVGRERSGEQPEGAPLDGRWSAVLEFMVCIISGWCGWFRRGGGGGRGCMFCRRCVWFPFSEFFFLASGLSACITEGSFTDIAVLFSAQAPAGTPESSSPKPGRPRRWEHRLTVVSFGVVGKETVRRRRQTTTTTRTNPPFPALIFILARTLSLLNRTDLLHSLVS